MIAGYYCLIFIMSQGALAEARPLTGRADASKKTPRLERGVNVGRVSPLCAVLEHFRDEAESLQIPICTLRSQLMRKKVAT